MELENYFAYLVYIEQKLTKLFEEQKPYIFCKKGCSKCCEYGYFPFKKIEVMFLMLGFKQLPEDTKIIILKKIEELKKAKQASNSKKFAHTCPFLINNECSVYNHRGVICRSFGLMPIRENGEKQVPFCAFEGLNYSNVLDLEKETISEEKFKQLDTDVEPLAYNISYEHLTSKTYEEVFRFQFGELRPLLDWL